MANRVLVAMSGGVDSSVSVKLLLDEGYDVAGATMRLYSNEDIGLDKTRTCCSLNDVEDARFVAFHIANRFSLLQRIWSITGLLWARLMKYTVTALWQEM